MDFGVHFGTRDCLVTRETIMTLAQRAEALGFSHIGVADHLVVPLQSDVRYPYTASGIWPGAPTGECLDVIATLAFLAGCTQRIKLLTSVAVVPYRPAVLAAKLLLTADVLSGGRVIAGVGAGWMREEFEALGTPPYAERGAITDEYIDVWKTVWTNPRASYDGTYTTFKDMVFMPQPVSKPHPPIWVGGESPPALRRVARFGDAWYPVSNNQQFRLNTPERLRAGVDNMRRVVEKTGRDPGSVDVGYLWFKSPSETVQMEPDGGRQLFTGSIAEWQEDAAALREAGAQHVILYIQRPSMNEMLDLMQRVSEAVVTVS